MERATSSGKHFLVSFPSLSTNRTHARLQVSLRQWRRAFPVILCTANHDLPSLSGDEPLEVLFMKELRKRGISPKILDDGENNSFSTAGAEARTQDSESEDYIKSNISMAEMKASSSWSDERNMLDKRERPMDLHSKGVAGRILIASFLHCFGGSFSLMLWPLLLSGIAVFLALYIYFGENLAHPGMAIRSSGLLIDPYQLLEEERAHLLRLGPITSSFL